MMDIPPALMSQPVLNLGRSQPDELSGLRSDFRLDGFHLALDPHRIEGTPGEEDADREERHGQTQAQVALELNRQLHREKAKQSGELDDRVHCDRGSILERIAYGVANHGCRVERGSLLFELYFDDFLCVVPGAAGVGHENRLVEAEDRDRDQIPDEEEWLEASKRQRTEE